MKSGDLIFLAIVIGFVFWLTGEEDTTTAYSLFPNDTRENGEPAWSPGAQTIYKIRNDNIVMKLGSTVSSYDSCTIFSIDDWLCGFEDGSGTFGMRDGEYFVDPPVEYDDRIFVSWFRHAVEGCKWDFYSGGLQVVSCPLRFVM